MAWDVLKQFGQIDKWHPAIAASVIEGTLPMRLIPLSGQDLT